MEEGAKDLKTTWKTFSLTHVEYPEGDYLGFILGCMSLSPIVILVSLATLICFRRDLHTICYTAGLVINEFINLVLKHLIRDFRPLRDRETVFTEYGMPSSHSQFMWFFSIYFVLFVFIRIHQMNNSTVLDNAWRYIVSLSALLLATIVSYGRVYLHYHTLSQVIYGGLIGTVLAIMWFIVVHICLTPLFPYIVSWPLSEYLLVRDCTPIPNVIWFEYTLCRKESGQRQRKMVSKKPQ